MSGSTSFERFLSASGRKTSGPPSPDAAAARDSRSLSALDSQQLSPNDSGTSHGARAGEASDEWHLSSIEEMVSLNWGDGSREGEVLSGDVEGRTEASAEDEGDQEAAPGLVQDNLSPPRQRLSSSTLPAPRVQFSPLSLCPSPLLGVPAPRTPHDSPTTRHLPRSVRAILKAPGTPGTGRSVRFSASIREQSIPHFADISTEDDSHFTNVASGMYEDVEEEELSVASTSDGSHIVASFLSKLQAVIPSPETSHTESSIVVPPAQPLVTVSSPTDTSKSFKIDRVFGLGTDENIFDTSAPQFGTGEDWSIANDEKTTHRALALSQNPFLSASARLSSTLVPLPHVTTRTVVVSSLPPSPPQPSLSSSPVQPPHQVDSPDNLSLVPADDATADAPESAIETHDASRMEPSVYGTPRTSLARDTSTSSPKWDEGDGDEEELDTSQQLEQSQYYNLDLTVDISAREPPSILAEPTNPGDMSLYDQTQYHDVSNTSLWDPAPSSPSSPPSSLVAYTSDLPHSPSSTMYTPLESTGSFIASLLSVQGDMLSNSSSQRQLLSSFVASLQTEVTRKDEFISRLSERNAQVEGELERIEAANSSTPVTLEASSNQASLAAVHRVVEQLTMQMAIDHASAEEERTQRYAEVSTLRAALREAKTSVRDSEIRLHHAQVSQVEAEVSRARAQEEADQQRELHNTLAADAEEIQADRDDLRLRIHHQRGDYANTIVELEEAMSAARASLVDSEERHAVLVLAGGQDLIDAEGLRSSQQATIDGLTLQATSVQEENDRLRERVEELDRLRMDDRVALERTSSERESWRQQVAGKDDELDRARAQTATLERALEDRSDAISTRDALLHAQSLELEELNDLVRRSRLQSEDQATEDIESLRFAMEQLTVVQQERSALVEQTQTLAGKLKSQEDECNRMKELVRTLRRESADREVKLLRLHRIKSELTEDCLGLNIALDAKQQEVQLWKRQASTRPPLIASIGPSDTALRPPSHLLPFETPSRSARRVKGASRRPAAGTVLKENERPRQELLALR